MLVLGIIRGFWRRRWAALRIGLAAALLAVMLNDNPARLARLQYAAMPDFDVVGEARRLRAAGQYDTALAALDGAQVDADGELAAAVACERERTIRERDDWRRRALEVGRGALTGTGDSLEALGGAIVADLFVVGDVRDLAIQGARLALDGETDEWILVLSGFGVATTLCPQIDAVPGLLKCAHKCGCLTRGMIEELASLVRTAAREGDFRQLERVGEAIRDLFKRASPAVAVRALRKLDDPKDVALLAEYLRRERRAPLVLHVLGDEAPRVLKSAAHEADDLLRAAAKKGPGGAAWLRTSAARLMRPHPIVGLAKGIYKGNAARAAQAIATRYLDPSGWWLLPATAAWLAAELILFLRRSRPQPSSAGRRVAPA